MEDAIAARCPRLGNAVVTARIWIDLGLASTRVHPSTGQVRYSKVTLPDWSRTSREESAAAGGLGSSQPVPETPYVSPVLFCPINPPSHPSPLVARLRQLLEQVLNVSENVAFSPDCVGEIAMELSSQLESGQTLLLENLRFHAGEEANDPAFAAKLAALCDVYVNDAFGSAHRAHASTEGITHFVKQCAAGLLMEKELNFLGKVLTDPDHPFVAIIGGSKISGKIDVIDNLLDKADTLLIGGGMAYTFLNALGQSTGKSLVEADKVDVATAALNKAKAKGVKLLLPVDHVLADKFAAEAKTQIFSGDGPFPADLMALDIGPATIDLFAKEIAEAHTILWNGPMGVFELAPFAHGTNAIAEFVAANAYATSIVGGGDSVAAVRQAGVADKITHISTGGGASLEFLEGKTLPGVAALTDK